MFCSIDLYYLGMKDYLNLKIAYVFILGIYLAYINNMSKKIERDGNYQNTLSKEMIAAYGIVCGVITTILGDKFVFLIQMSFSRYFVLSLIAAAFLLFSFILPIGALLVDEKDYKKSSKTEESQKKKSKDMKRTYNRMSGICFLSFLCMMFLLAVNLIPKM